jgi:hypothetical protein
MENHTRLQTQPASIKEEEQASGLTFFDAVYQVYQKATVRSGGAIDRFYRIAGFPVRLSFAGQALLLPITRALAHLTINPVPTPALSICLWDSASTHTGLGPLPWHAEDYLEDGETRGFANHRFSTTYQADAHVLNILDHARNLGIYVTKSARGLPYYEIGHPLRVLLHTWTTNQGMVPVHAGAVGLPNGGVLLIGKGGTGKSNAALACLQSDLCYASDDFCLLATEPTLTVHSLYSSGKIHPADLQRLPHLAPMISNRDHLDSEKALFFLNEHVPEKILPSFPIQAMVIPRVRQGTKTSLQIASPAAALQALAPSTIRLSPHTAPETFHKLARIVRQVPAFYLHLGSDPRQVPEVILEFLRKN